jgi:hypothetical protein
MSWVGLFFFSLFLKRGVAMKLVNMGYLGNKEQGRPNVASPLLLDILEELGSIVGYES